MSLSPRPLDLSGSLMRAVALPHGSESEEPHLLVLNAPGGTRFVGPFASAPSAVAAAERIEAALGADWQDCDVRAVRLLAPHDHD